MANKSLLNTNSDFRLLLNSTKVIDRDFIIANPESFPQIVDFIRTSLFGLSGYYPLFDQWLESKVLPGMLSGERCILMEYYRRRFSGLAIIKDDGIEQKLCCLRVMPEFQGSGTGLRLFERAFEHLENDMPLLSIAEEQRGTFKKLFSHYGFELAKEYKSYYRPLKDELSFNGLIEPKFIPLPSSSRITPNGLILPTKRQA
ncbi:GNAT family N-acetyltransferase [Pseudomonas sp. NEEL19]|uniref:GNAT family N-acetyltransferase n=1 Tax=Pseudomonas sp. NEEL19 TaxID=2867409 RepID=UPI0023681879|nr:GNAT family N-acetyltransferase [Pseudomonas sp. NEEL19]WDM59975.1 GNAT family N-acetyltransferase [Pseudomonas sp. NEEL19]